MSLYGEVMGPWDLLWIVLGFGLAVVFGGVAKSSWISSAVLTCFLLIKTFYCIGFSALMLFEGQEFDAAGYYVAAQNYKSAYLSLISQYDTRDILNLPAFDGSGNSTDRLTAAVGALLLISGNSFIAASLFFCWAGTVGQLLILRFLIERFPNIPSRLFLVMLFHPSSSIWTSLLLKDSMGCLGLGLILYSLNVLRLRSWCPKAFVSASLGVVLCLLFRGFILAPVSALAIGLFYDALFPRSDCSSRNQSAAKLLYVLISLASLFILGSWVKTTFGAELVEIQRQLNSTNGQIGGGSTFTNFDLSLSLGDIYLVPGLVANTFLRPFPWEVSKPIHLFAVLENTVTIWVFVLGWWRYSSSRVRLSRLGVTGGLAVGTLAALLIGAVGIGAFSSNSGTISRYRAPLLPFLLTVPLAAIAANGTLTRQRRYNGPIKNRPS